MSGSITNQADLTYAVPTGFAAVMLAGVVTVLWRMTLAPAPVAPMQTAMMDDTAMAPIAMTAPARPAQPAYRIAAATPRRAPAPATTAPVTTKPAPVAQPRPVTTSRLPAGVSGSKPIPAAASPVAATPIASTPIAAAPIAAAPVRLAAAPPSFRRVVVRKGETLWQIARDNYGEGGAYTAIFQANKAQLSSAGVIHPGQVLVLPVLSASWHTQTHLARMTARVRTGAT